MQAPIYQLQPGLEEAYFHGAAGLSMMGGALGPSHDEPGAMYAASELNDPEYSTDDFRMFSFKVARCSKRYVHDWRSCPFAHPTENARRRDPRTTRYLPVPCPDYKRGICMRGDACPYSHGVYECWLHPAKYRTQLCKEGPSCRRPVCFFAHSVADLRQPTHLWNGGDPNSAAAAAAAAGAASAAAALMNQQAPRHVSSGSGDAQIAAEEAFNNMQEAGIPEPSSSGPPAAVIPVAVPMPRQVSNDSPVTGTPRSNSIPAPAEEEASPTAAAVAVAAAVAQEEEQQVQVQLEALRSGSLSRDDSAFAAAAAAAMSPTKAADAAAEDSSPLSPDASAAMAAAASAAASRLSMDSAMQARAANAVAVTAQPSWTQSLAASATAAAALAGVPVNEQPMLPNHGPRMSNAVARKLGLAPVKPPAAAAAAAVAAAAAARAPIPVPGAQAQAQAAYRASMDDIRISQALSGLNGAAAAAAVGGMTFQYGAPDGGPVSYPSTYPGADSLGIHPALLNLVAANMSNGGGNGAAEAAAMQAQAQHQAQMFAFGAPAGGMRSNGSGDDGGVASLLGHMSQWGLNDGGGSSDDSSVHSSTKASASFPHRGSSEGMLGATAMPQAPGASGQQSYSMLGLEMDANNHNGVSSEC